MTPNLPSSGSLLSFVLNVLDEFKFTADSLKGWNNTILTYHRIIETWKYAYSMRSKMGDDLFVDMTQVRNLSKNSLEKIKNSLGKVKNSLEFSMSFLSMTEDESYLLIDYQKIPRIYFKKMKSP